MRLMLIECGCLSNYWLQTNSVTNNPEISPETLAMLESIQFFHVLNKVRIFLEALDSSNNDLGQEMNNKRNGLVFSGKGKPQNIHDQQVVLKYRITILHISTLLKYTISIKRHHLQFYINSLLRDLFVKCTASGKLSVSRTDLESCKRLIWRLCSQCMSGIHVYSVFKFY